MTKKPFLSSATDTPLSGDVTIPGDKSMSHRSLMFGLLADGKTRITGLLEGEDVMSTADAARALGATITKDSASGTWHVEGTGSAPLKQPQNDLDMGNSGTSTRLLMGLIAGYGVTATLTGDESLSKRPMNRVIKPLEQMGAKFDAAEGGRLPLTLHGSEHLKAIEYTLPVASAQVKSAILLAGLNATGTTTVIEPKPTRDHTENMLRAFGAEVTVEKTADGLDAIHIQGPQSLTATDVTVYSDPSSAAFPAVAATLVSGSDITLRTIGLNPRRAGIFETLIEMGADITYSNQHESGGEPIADIRVRYNGPLKGITVPAERVPSMIDEFPILSMAASCAQGTTYMTGLEELRVKESDRLHVVAKNLAACGVDLEEGQESLTINGNGHPPAGGADIETELDHRIAMSFLILGLVTKQPICIDDMRPILTSFPNFMDLMAGLGANFTPAE